MKIKSVYYLINQFKNCSQKLIRETKTQKSLKMFSGYQKENIRDHCLKMDQKRIPLSLKIKHFNNVFHTNFSYRNFYTLIKSMGFRYKTIKYDSVNLFAPETKQERYKVSLYVAEKLNCNYDLVVIDETSFTDGINFKKGWDIKGTGHIIVPNVKTFISLSLIMAISLRFGILSFQFIQGFFNAENFYQFVKKTALNYREKTENNSKFILFFDQCPSHSSKEVIF